MNSPVNIYPVPGKALLVLGYGDLAERLASRLDPESWRLHGVCRSIRTSAVATLSQADLSIAAGLGVALAQEPDQILITLTPDRRDPQAYASTYLRSTENLIRFCQSRALVPHIIFVSSTAVYGQDDGSLVDEQSVTNATRFNGQILREAEKLLEASALPLTILRCSGIYGRRKSGLEERLRGDSQNFRPEHWTNRIHVDDVLGVIEFALDRYADAGEPLGTLLASDLCPVQEGVLENWLRDRLKMPPLYWAPAVASGKRCSSLRLQRLGYRFVVEDYRVGYLDGR